MRIRPARLRWDGTLALALSYEYYRHVMYFKKMQMHALRIGLSTSLRALHAVRTELVYVKPAHSGSVRTA
jgi:hypothetical protein